MVCAAASFVAVPALPVTVVMLTAPTSPLTETTSLDSPSILSQVAPSKIAVSPAFH